MPRQRSHATTMSPSSNSRASKESRRPAAPRPAGKGQCKHSMAKPNQFKIVAYFQRNRAGHPLLRYPSPWPHLVFSRRVALKSLAHAIGRQLAICSLTDHCSAAAVLSGFSRIPGLLNNAKASFGSTLRFVSPILAAQPPKATGAMVRVRKRRCIIAPKRKGLFTEAHKRALVKHLVSSPKVTLNAQDRVPASTIDNVRCSTGGC